MSRNRPAASLRAKAAWLALALAASLAAVPAAAQAQRQTFTVASAKELLRAVGPNRTIVLKKGDYKLSSAYDVKSDYVSWNDADDGKELALSGLENVTFRGADGTRLVSDSGQAYLLGIYGGSGILFDNIAFVRSVADDVEVSAGSVYAESATGLSFDRCSFSGPTGYPLELWECEDLTIKRARIEGGRSGALYSGYVQGLELSGSTVRGNEGYPLLYLEESDGVHFTATTFEGNSGSNFIEIYSEEGYVEDVAFSSCVFKDNDFEYFSGSDVLPVTEDCAFEGSSFDENWAEGSVASSYEDYYGEDEGPAFYTHYDAGFAFSYPWEWELQEGGQGRLALYSPDGEVLVFFSTAMPLPAKFDAAKQGKKAFADASLAFVKLLKDEVGLTLSVKAEGEPYEAGGFLNADFVGQALRGEGEKAAARVRFFVSKGQVQAMAAFALDEAALEPDSTADFIVGSIETASEEGE